MNDNTTAAIEELRSGAPLPDLSEFPVPGSVLDQRLEAVAECWGGIELARIKLDRAVKRARDEGASWSHIGMSVGMSKQAAHKRWGADACSGVAYLVNPDAPDEGTDIHHEVPCPVHP